MWVVRQLFSVMIVVWLVVGALAAWERGYFQELPTDCARVATIASVISVGPLNYLGMNPRLERCHVQLAQPS